MEAWAMTKPGKLGDDEEEDQDDADGGERLHPPWCRWRAATVVAYAVFGTRVRGRV